jgi:predicted transcriptional regulator
MSQQTTGIKLDVELKDRLRQLGDRRDRSPHWLIKTAVVEYLAREERYEQERQEDEERWQRYQLTDEAVSQQEVFQHFDKLRQNK